MRQYILGNPDACPTNRTVNTLAALATGDAKELVAGRTTEMNRHTIIQRAFVQQNPSTSNIVKPIQFLYRSARIEQG